MGAERHLSLLAEAKVAIDRVHGDTSVDRATTRESLEELRAQVSSFLDAMDEDDDD